MCIRDRFRSALRRPSRRRARFNALNAAFRAVVTSDRSTLAQRRCFVLRLPGGSLPLGPQTRDQRRRHPHRRPAVPHRLHHRRRPTTPGAPPRLRHPRSAPRDRRPAPGRRHRARHPCHEGMTAIPRPPPMTRKEPPPITDNAHHSNAGGPPVTDETIQPLADEAETGYDTTALRRKGGRRPIGSAAARVIPVRVDPDLEKALKAVSYTHLRAHETVLDL